MAERVGVYPGTFDPITNGHLDIIQRACRSVDRLIVGVARNAGKSPLFSLEDRVAMVQEDLAALSNPFGTVLEVRPFEGLLMHFAQDCSATQIFRGLRAVSDFEYEFQMAGMNARLNPDIETLFLMASERCQLFRRASSRKSAGWAAISLPSCLPASASVLISAGPWTRHDTRSNF